MSFDAQAPLVSIIIASYNHELYIEECILSIINQTYKRIELIVVDDGSQDNSSEILGILANQYDFYYERQNNIGLTRTLNKMLKIARGKYVVSFGSDDVMLPWRIEKQVAFMESHPEITVLGANVVFIDAEGRALKKQRISAARKLVFEDFFINSKPGIQAASAFVRMEVFHKEGFYDPDIQLEDLQMWFKLSNKGYQFYVMDEFVSCYRKHPTNTYRNIQYMLECAIKSIDPYNNHADYPVVKRQILKHYFISASKKDISFAIKILRQMSYRDFKKISQGLLHFPLTWLRQKLSEIR